MVSDDDGGGRVCAFLTGREPNAIGVDAPGPVATITGSEMPCPGQEFGSRRRQPRPGRRHGAFGRLGRRHPRLVRHTAGADSGHQHLCPARLHPSVRFVPRQSTRQYGVVPVHGPTGFWSEGCGPGHHGTRQQCRRAAPGSGVLVMTEGLGHGGPAGQRVLERRAGGQEGELRRHAIRVDRPRDLPAGPLVTQAPADGPFHHRPCRLQQMSALAQLGAPPHAGGHIRARVGVPSRLGDAVGHISRAPAPFGQLLGGQPIERPLGFGPAPAGGEGHGRLDVVPRVSVGARHTRGPCRQPFAPRQSSRPSDGSRPASERSCRRPVQGFAGINDQALAQHRVEHGFGPSRQWSLGRDVPHQKAVVCLHDGVGLAIGAERAAKPPIRAVQRVGVMEAKRREPGTVEALAYLAVPVDADVTTRDVVVLTRERPVGRLRVRIRRRPRCNGCGARSPCSRVPEQEV